MPAGEMRNYQRITVCLFCFFPLFAGRGNLLVSLNGCILLSTVCLGGHMRYAKCTRVD